MLLLIDVGKNWAQEDVVGISDTIVQHERSVIFYAGLSSRIAVAISEPYFPPTLFCVLYRRDAHSSIIVFSDLVAIRDILHPLLGHILM